MVLIVSGLAVLALIPTSVQLLATGQLPVSQRAVYEQQALEAARAGLSDYINHLTNPLGELQYCSKYYCSTNNPSKDPNNHAFADTPGDSNWAIVQNAGSSGNVAGQEAFQYLVNTSGLNLSDPSAQTFPVLIIGRAGPTSNPVYQTLKATLQVVPSTLSKTWNAPNPPASCTPTVYTPPAGASYAQVTLMGAEGGGQGGSSYGGGGLGNEVSFYAPVESNTVWVMYPGVAGQQGQEALVAINPSGGAACAGTMGLGGGNGGSVVINALSAPGGGGGGATAICIETSGSNPPACQGGAPGTASPVCQWSSGAYQTLPCFLGVAGGGGGQGGTACALVCLVSSTIGGQGGYTSSSASNGNGANGGPVCVLGGLLCVPDLGLLSVAQGGAQGASATTEGVAGANELLGVYSGGGGGGGGGYQTGGGAGQAGGLLNLLGIEIAGAGGGGGLGSSKNLTSVCSGSPSPGPAQYPGGDTTGNGVVAATFYSGVVCSGTPLSVSVSFQQVQPWPNPTS